MLIQTKEIEGLVLPPRIGHFNPELFITKISSIEVYNGKTKELLLKLYNSRGIFSYGYTFPEVMEKFKQGLIQAGWKEKKEIPVSEEKKSSGN